MLGSMGSISVERFQSFTDPNKLLSLVRGPLHHLRRGTFAPHPASLCLQRHQNVPVIEQRCASLSLGSADQKHQILPHIWRISSPLCAGLGLRRTHRANDPVLSSSDVPVLAIVSSEDLHTRSIGRHDWQQQKGFTFLTAVQRRMASKDIGRPIITVIVQPWSGAA